MQDLLELSSSRDSLVVRWSTDRGFYVEDLFTVTCETEDDLMAVLEEGRFGVVIVTVMKKELLFITTKLFPPKV